MKELAPHKDKLSRAREALQLAIDAAKAMGWALTWHLYSSCCLHVVVCLGSS